MPLINFGSILNFAEEIETQDADYYASAAETSAGAGYKDLFTKLSVDGKKRIKIIQRTRRENVTEMILEAIQDFTRAPFQCTLSDVSESDTAQLLNCAKEMETRAVNYYQQAALKLKALPEVARELKRLAKKRQAVIKQIGEL
jgi:rubrerythrin